MSELYVTTSEFIALKGERIKVGTLLKKSRRSYLSLDGKEMCHVKSHNGMINVKLHEEELISEDF